MSMRTHKLVTWLRPDQAHALIELLDQLRDVLQEAYGDEIGAMLREAGAPPTHRPIADGEEPF